MDKENSQVKKKIFHNWLDSTFLWIAFFTSYTFSVSFFSTAVAGVTASLFALYYFDAVGVEISEFSMMVLKIGIVLYWILIATQLGLFRRLGFPSVGNTIKTLNEFIVIEKHKIIIPNYLKPFEYKALLKSLLIFPLFNGLNLAFWIFTLVIFMAGFVYFIEGPKFNLIGAIFIVGLIAIFIAISFSYVLSEFLTGPMREECKRILADKNISYKDRAISSIRVKLVLFLVLFIVNLFLSNTLTYYNGAEIKKVWHFGFLAVGVSMLLAHAIFKLIYNSLKQIEQASYDLMQGGSGQIYSRSLDREFINVAVGINKAGKTIRDYQQSLEDKVILRTRELNQALDSLKKKEHIIETELNFAADIQKCILPENLSAWNGIQFAAYYQPMGKVSGDYYDIFTFPSQVYVLMADVSGHGVPAALITMAAKQAFSTHIQEGILPSDLFKRVNLEITERVQTSDYLSAFLVRIDTKHKILYSNAAHPKAIHYKAQTGDYELLDSEGMFIGSLNEANDYYEDREAQLSSGDRFFLYTDGVIEHKDPAGEEFGLDRVIEVLKRYETFPIREQIDKLIESLYSHIDAAPIKDDISIIAFELESSWNHFIEIYNQGVKFLKSKNLGKALEFLGQAHRLIPNYHGLQFQLALVQYHLGDLDSSEQHIQNFIKEKPFDKTGLQLAANIFTKNGKKTLAKEILQKLKQLESEESEIEK
jgi:phosphoserine phosphatase RsbU/P